MHLNRREMLSAIVLPFSAGLPDQADPPETACKLVGLTQSDLVELAPLLATAESKSDDRAEPLERLGAIQWREGVVLVYACCPGELCEQVLEAAGELTENPLAFSWARDGGAWVLFMPGNFPEVVLELATIAPASWAKVTNRKHSVTWGRPAKGGAA